MDDDDGSSSLSIPNESIDFDLVYSLHSFAATVEGQANVVKGVEIESASLDYSCDQDKKENGISDCLCEVQRQTDR